MLLHFQHLEPCLVYNKCLITDSIDVSLSKLQEIVNDREAWHALVHGVSKSWTQLAAKSLQLCLTLWDPIDSSPPGSPVPGILKARTLEWAAVSFSNVWKWKVKVKSLSRVRLLATWWTTPYQAPPSTGFSRQEYWSGVPLPSPWTQLSEWITTTICLVINW